MVAFQPLNVGDSLQHLPLFCITEGEPVVTYIMGKKLFKEAALELWPCTEAAGATQRPRTPDQL